MKTIGEIIKGLRESRGWSMGMLELKTGVRTSEISRYERNITTPSCYNLISLADAFDISLDELVGRKFNNKED